MIAIFKYIVLGLVLYTNVEAYVGIILPQEKPLKYADKEGCYYSEFDVMIPYKATFKPVDNATGVGRCEEFVCATNGEIHIEGCSSKQIDGCEKIPGDLQLPYPECCDKVRCTNPDGTFTDF